MENNKLYSLDKDLLNMEKKPSGFIFRNKTVLIPTTKQNTTQWCTLYYYFLEELYNIDKDAFSRLPEEDKFVSSHGRHYFVRNKNDFNRLRYSMPLRFTDFYADKAFNANQIRDRIKELLEYFKFKKSDFKFIP